MHDSTLFFDICQDILKYRKFGANTSGIRGIRIIKYLIPAMIPSKSQTAFSSIFICTKAAGRRKYIASCIIMAK